jgi:hypothetical protein
MELKEDFHLEYGQTAVLKKVKGTKVVEFSRHPDKEILDNIVLMKSYDSRKKTSVETSWIILKDLFSFMDMHLRDGEYELEIEGTKEPKKSKK